MRGENHCYRFDDYTVDLDRAGLLHKGIPVRLRPQAFEALKYLVEHRGRLATKAELMDVLWPRIVVTDDSLVKCISEVRHALGGKGNRYVKTVPRRGYIFDAAVTEQHGAAPAEDPEQARPARERVGGGIGRVAEPRQKRALHRIAPMLLLAATVLAVALWLAIDREPAAPARLANSVAVLPFENLSPDPDNAYFAAGIHEAVLDRLVNLGHVNTIARSSVLYYSGRQLPLREVAEQLNVATVMEGSVRYADGRVVVTAQLIDPETGAHIWSEQYDRPFADIFAIQSDIAARIAVAFDATLPEGERQAAAVAPTRSPDAYQLYLKGRYHWDKWLPADIRRSIEYYEQAIRIDPEFALAYTGLADALTALNGLGAVRPDEVMPRAREAALLALQLDPGLAEAHVSLGLIRHFYDWDYAAGDASFERAIELEPDSATAHHLYGKNLPVTSGTQPALAALERALELEPYSVGITKDLGETLYYARRYHDAIERFEQTLALEPDYVNAYFWLVRCYEALGRHNDAIRMHAEMVRRGYADYADVASADADPDWQAYWQRDLERLGALAGRVYVEPYRLVEASLRVGDPDGALRWLDECFDVRCSWIPTIAFDPLLDSLHGDARYLDLLERAGLSPRESPGARFQPRESSPKFQRSFIAASGTAPGCIRHDDAGRQRKIHRPLGKGREVDRTPES